MSTTDTPPMVMCPCCGRLFDAAELKAEAVVQCACETLFGVPDRERVQADRRRATDLLSTPIRVDRAGQGSYTCPGPAMLADWIDQGRVAGSDLLELQGQGGPVLARCHALTAECYGQDAERDMRRPCVERLLLTALGTAVGVTIYDGREQLLALVPEGTGAEAGGAVRATGLDDADVEQRIGGRLAELRDRLRATAGAGDAPAADAFALIATGPFPELEQADWAGPTDDEAADMVGGSQASGEPLLLLDERPAGLSIELKAPEPPAPEPATMEAEEDLGLVPEEGVSMAALAAAMEADAADTEEPAPVDPAAPTVTSPPDAKAPDSEAAKLDFSDLQDFTPEDKQKQSPSAAPEPTSQAESEQGGDDVMELKERDLFDEDEDDSVLDAELLDEQ